eukprot:403333431
MEQLESYLDKVQLEIEDSYQIKKCTEIVKASEHLKLYLSTITAFTICDQEILFGTSMGNLIVVDSNLQKIQHIHSLDFLISSDHNSYISFIKRNVQSTSNQSYLMLGTSLGIFAIMSYNNHKLEPIQSVKLREQTKIIDVKCHQNTFLVIQDNSITIVNQELNVLKQVMVSASDGLITQVSVNIKQPSQILLSTSLNNHFIWNVQSENLSSLSPQNTNQFSQQFTGSCINPVQQNLILTQTNSQISHYQRQTLAHLYTSTYRSKKIKNINFGHLFTLNSDDALLSVNPLDSLVLINIESNKLLSYEQLSQNDNELEYSFYEIQQSKDYKDTYVSKIVLIGQYKSSKQLVIGEYQIMSLRNSFTELVTQDKIKNAIKLCLKYKCLNSDLKILQPLLVKLLRKKQKPELLESKEYKVLMQIVQQLEQNILMRSDQQINVNPNQFEEENQQQGKM